MIVIERIIAFFLGPKFTVPESRTASVSPIGHFGADISPDSRNELLSQISGRENKQLHARDPAGPE